MNFPQHSFHAQRQALQASSASRVPASQTAQGFSPVLTILSEAQSHQVWARLLKQPTAPDLDALLAFYNNQGQRFLENSLHQTRYTWAKWLTGTMVLMEGLGTLQRLVEEDPHCGEAWHFLAFFQWECGLKAPAQTSAQNALKLAPVLNIQTRHLITSWALQEQLMSLAVLQHGFLLMLAESIQPVVSLLGYNRLGSSQRLQTNSRKTPFAVSKKGAIPDAWAKEFDEMLANEFEENEHTPFSHTFSQSSAHEFENHQFPKHPNSSEIDEVTALLDANQVDEAIRVMEARIALHPNEGDLHFELAKILQNHGSFTKSLYHLRVALNTMPHHAKSYYHMGEVLKSMDDIDGCIEAYKTAITFGIDPLWTAQVSRQLARIYEEHKGDTDHAFACMQLAQELEPANINDLFSLAEAHCKAERYDEAVDVYQKILRFQPENAEVYGFLGYLYWQAGRHQEAEKAYKKAISLNKQNPIALNNLGVLYLEVWQDFNEARKYFEEAKGLDPSYAMARFNLGRTLVKLKQGHLAKPLFQEALHLNDKSHELAPADIEALMREL
ncbi:MAG: tetratricopeptide repeat protein [Vampirovibrionales bacterium]